MNQLVLDTSKILTPSSAFATPITSEREYEIVENILNGSKYPQPRMDHRLGLAKSPVVKRVTNSSRYVAYRPSDSRAFGPVGILNGTIKGKLRTPKLQGDELPAVAVSTTSAAGPAAVLTLRKTLLRKAAMAGKMDNAKRANLGLGRNGWELKQEKRGQKSKSVIASQMDAIKAGAKCYVNYERDKGRVGFRKNWDGAKSSAELPHVGVGGLVPQPKKHNMFEVDCFGSFENYKRILKGSVYRLQTYLKDAEIARIQQYSHLHTQNDNIMPLY